MARVRGVKYCWLRCDVIDGAEHASRAARPGCRTAMDAATPGCGRWTKCLGGVKLCRTRTTRYSTSVAGRDWRGLAPWEGDWA